MCFSNSICDYLLIFYWNLPVITYCSKIRYIFLVDSVNINGACFSEISALMTPPLTDQNSNIIVSKYQNLVRMTTTKGFVNISPRIWIHSLRSFPEIVYSE